VQASAVRQLFLAQIARHSELSDGPAEGEKVRIALHALDLRPAQVVIYTLSV